MASWRCWILEGRVECGGDAVRKATSKPRPREPRDLDGGFGPGPRDNWKPLRGLTQWKKMMSLNEE